MKIFLFSVFFLFFFKCLFSQQTDTLVLAIWENGFAREVKIIFGDSSWQVQRYFSDGNIQSEVNFNKSGQLNGMEKSWFEGGAKKKESNWRTGINIGSATLWYPSGQKSFEGKYLENGVPEGAWKGWYENGQVHYEQNYSNGFKTGKWFTYKKDGGVELIQYYEMGTLIKEEKF